MKFVIVHLDYKCARTFVLYNIKLKIMTSLLAPQHYQASCVMTDPEGLSGVAGYIYLTQTRAEQTVESVNIFG